MPRPASADNSIFFRGNLELPHAERILRALENAHDNYALMEMNGTTCAGRQISKLRWYDRPPKSVTRD